MLSNLVGEKYVKVTAPEEKNPGNKVPSWKYKHNTFLNCIKRNSFSTKSKFQLNISLWQFYKVYQNFEAAKKKKLDARENSAFKCKKNNTQVNWYFLYILVSQLEGDWQTTIIN